MYMYIGAISQGPVNKPISLQELKSLDGRAVTKVHVHMFLYSTLYHDMNESTSAKVHVQCCIYLTVTL